MAARVNPERETHYSRGYLSRVENGVQRMTEDLAQACDRALAAEGELLAAARNSLGQECPYPGRSPYSEDTAKWFFGRDEAMGKLLTEVRRQLRRGCGPGWCPRCGAREKAGPALALGRRRFAFSIPERSRN